MRRCALFQLLAVLALACRANAQPSVPVRSTVQIYDLKSGKTRTVFQGDGFYEAPYWSADGKWMFISGGVAKKLYRIPRAGGAPQLVELGDIDVNHDQALSPDGKIHAISLKGELFVSGPAGKDRHQLTKPGDVFYLHAWSSDSKWILGTRRFAGTAGETNYDICRLTPDGNQDERLTNHAALDDGPDYGNGGRFIYFNSKRAGGFDIWRMPESGAGEGDKLAVQVTHDAAEDWFPHPSPNGKWLALLSYPPGTGTGITLTEYLAKYPEKGLSGYNLTMHPYNAEVVIRLRTLPGDQMHQAKIREAKIRTVGKLLGGQGSMNLNSWLPDSSGFAFIGYEVVR